MMADIVQIHGGEGVGLILRVAIMEFIGPNVLQGLLLRSGNGLYMFVGG